MFDRQEIAYLFLFGGLMKRIFAFTLATFIVILSIFIYCPVGVYANDDFTLSKSYDSTRNGFSLSSSESTNAINNKGDIYTSDHLLMFMYTPTSNYNWTSYAKNTVLTLHFSDSQLKNILMSSTPYENLFYMIQSLGNTETVRGLASYVGYIFTGKSDMGDKLVDTLTNNYNYLNAIDYNEDTQTITMSNDNGSVDKLREEIKLQYYKDNGMFYIGGSLNKPTDIIKSSWYDDMTLYQEDYNAVSNYDFAIGSDKNAFYFNSSDYSYIYLYLKSDSYFGSGNPYNNASVWWQFTDNDLNPVTLPNYTKSLNCTEYTSTKEYNMIYNEYAFRFYTWYSSNVRGNYSERLLNNIKERVCIDTASTSYGVNPYVQWKTENLTDNSYYDYISSSFFYSNPNKTFVGFTSYEALFNYVHGESSSYLGSAINKVGEDISFSIKDMSGNLGEKMDTLIDSINSGKGNMSADELQNAIDKGIENLNKNTEDIKDNTSDILDVLREQNQILLDILGVTTNIYKVVKESDSKEKTYNINYVQSVFNSMFKGLKNAVLYGENTVRDDVSEDTDDIDSIVSDIPPDKKNYHNGLFGRFPFSVPYQLFDWLQALYVEPVAPKFTLSYAYLFRDLGYETNNFEFVIDLGDEKYSKWIELVRSGEKLSFIIYMAIATYHRFKNEI